MTSNKERAFTLVTAKVLLGASLAYGFASLPAAHADTPITIVNQVDNSTESDPSDDNSIVRLADGSIDDCTVTHANGDRADFHTECDDYWSWR